MTDRTALILTADGEVAGGHSTDPVTPLTAVEEISQADARFVAHYATWSAASRATFPTLGSSYHAFENEIVESAAADHATIVTKYLNVYRGSRDNIDAAAIVRERAKLQSFVTNYIAWVA